MFIFRYIINFLRNIRINRICRKYGIENYVINKDGSIDVDDTVYLSYRKLYRLPLKFNKVSGSFNCYRNYLTSLEGCPNYVGRNFYCENNKLTSLEGCPSYVGISFNCSCNELTSLIGCPKEVGGYFDCQSNYLTSLDGCPKEEYSSLYSILTNPIYEVVVIFDNIKIYLDYQETYNFLRKDSKIVKHRLDEAIKDYNEYYNKNIRLPKSFYRYVYI